MKYQTFAALTLGALTLAGCATTQGVTRADTNALTFHQDAKTDVLPIQQAAALNLQARKIVQGSTVRGAMIGAAVGCGVGVAVGSKGKCLQAAALGAAGGALVGNMQGKASVDKRMRLAGSTDLARDIRAADAQMQSLTQDLPVYLAQQDARLKADHAALKSGTLSQAEYDRRRDIIRRDRAALAEALTLTERQTRAAGQNLSKAAAKGQSGLDWHIARTGKIADEATSARSTISLL